MKAWQLIAGAFLVLALAGANYVRVQAPKTLDFDEVSPGASVTALTDTVGSTEVLIRNRTDVSLCVEVNAGKDDCTGVTMTCVDDNTADDDLFIIPAGVTDTLTKPPGATLCGKQPGAIGNSKAVRVVEVVQ